MIKTLLKNIFPEKIKKQIKTKLGVPDQEASLLRLKKLGFSPSFILDIGAYEGNWCKFIKSIFPQASVMMVEGQVNKTDILQKISSELPGVHFKTALLGSEKKEVEFNIYDTASSVLKEENETGAKIERRQLSILDEIVLGTDFGKPDLLKVDTQGYELEILKGGITTLTSAQVVLLEVSMIDIYKDSPLVSDVLDFMKSHGFVLYDICSIMRRPYDNALFQSDFLFVKEDSLFRSSKKWA